MWFYVHLAVLFLLSFYLYCWIGVWNDFDAFNTALFEYLGFWFNWTKLILGVTSFVLICQAALFIAHLCSVPAYSTSRFSLVSKVFVIFVGLTSTFGYVAMAITWREELPTVKLFIRMTWPYLHPAACVLTTIAFCGKLYVSREPCSVKYILFVVWVYCVFLIMPLLVNSPCVREGVEKCKKPLVFGNKGNPKIAPENTLMSFKETGDVYGFGVDVSLSLDGVPFILQDRLLTRTTDVETVFQVRSLDPAESFRWNDLLHLDAGTWFLETDPHGAAGGLSGNERAEVSRQRVMSLYKLCVLAKLENKAVLVNTHRPLVADHPRSSDYIQVIVESILASSVLQSQVIWTSGSHHQYVLSAAPGFRRAHNGHVTARDVTSRRISLVIVKYNDVTKRDIDRYRRLFNISTIVRSSSTQWTFSMAWCQCAYAVVSDDPLLHLQMKRPIWRFTPFEFKKMWLSWYIACIIVSAVALVKHLRVTKARPK